MFDIASTLKASHIFVALLLELPMLERYLDPLVLFLRDMLVTCLQVSYK